MKISLLQRLSWFCALAFLVVARPGAAQTSGTDTLSEEALRAYVTRLHDAALALRNECTLAAENAALSRTKAEVAYQTAKQDSLANKETLEALEKNLKSAINAQKSAEKRAKQSKTLHTNAAILRGAEPAEQRKKAPVLWDELKKMSTKPERPPVPDGPSATAEPSKVPNKKKPKKEVNPQPEKPVAEIISAAETPANSSMDTLGKGTDPSKKAPKKEKKPKKAAQPVENSDLTTAPPVDTMAVPKKQKRVKKSAQPVDSTSLGEVPSADTMAAAPKKQKRAKTASNSIPLADSSAAPVKKRGKLALGKKDDKNEAPIDSTATVATSNRPQYNLAHYKTYSIATDVMLKPPAPPCALSLDARDEFSGEVRRETARGELFRHTNPALRHIIQSNNHVVCEASLVQNGAQAYLNLIFTVNDANAPRTHGGLAKNGVAFVKFLDGTLLNLTNIRGDEGKADPTGKIWTFQGQYPLDKTNLRTIRSEGLDKIRLAWANGYEDYEVQDVLLLGRLSKCLWE